MVAHGTAKPDWLEPRGIEERHDTAKVLLIAARNGEIACHRDRRNDHIQGASRLTCGFSLSHQAGPGQRCLDIEWKHTPGKDGQRTVVTLEPIVERTPLLACRHFEDAAPDRRDCESRNEKVVVFLFSQPRHQCFGWNRLRRIADDVGVQGDSVSQVDVAAGFKGPRQVEFGAYQR